MLMINSVPIECINQAAIYYQVPAPLIISVLKTEGGRVGLASKNNNGTYDFGPMQINSSHWPQFYQYKINGVTVTPERVLNNACFNVAIGTWMLHKELVQNTEIWRAIGNYHSHTNSKNYEYAAQIEKRYQHILRVISS